jgi:hypothetical protein
MVIIKYNLISMVYAYRGYGSQCRLHIGSNFCAWVLFSRASYVSNMSTVDGNARGQLIALTRRLVRAAWLGRVAGAGGGVFRRAWSETH